MTKTETFLTDEEVTARFHADWPDTAEEAKEWYESRPEQIQAAIRYRPPQFLYKMNNSYVFLYSFEENDDGTCTTCSVCVTARFNPNCMFERNVFGVLLSELKPVCHQEDLEKYADDEREPLLKTDEEIQEYFEYLRARKEQADAETQINNTRS